MKNKKFVHLAMIALLVISIPLTSFADKKENKNKKDEVKIATLASSTNGSGKAFGHLIAPGWIKNNWKLEIGNEDRLPKGIVKVLNKNLEKQKERKNEHKNEQKNLTIKKLSIRAGVDSANVVWKTNQKSDSALWLSTITSVNNLGTPTVFKANLTSEHKINLSGLTASTTYYLLVQSKTSGGKIATSSVMSFTTKTTPPPVIKPISINRAVVIVGTSSVTANWTTNIPSTSKIFYSTTAPVNQNATSTGIVLNNSLVTNHSLTVTGLSTSTLYHMIIQSTDANANIKSTGEFSLTTGI